LPGVWWVCGLLFFATVLNYLDRQVLALTADKIIHEFHLTNEGFGRIIAAFRYSYAAFQIAGGWVADAFGAGRIYPAAVGLWSCAGLATAFAGSATSLAGFRFLLGMGEAFNWPCALKVTQRLLSPEDRSLANGIFNGGAATGAMLAPVIVTLLAMRFGWRSPFVATGALGVAWIAAWLVMTRRYRGQLGGAPFSFAGMAAAALRILAKRQFWLLAVSAVIVNSVSYFLADWIPLYLKTQRGFNYGTGNLFSILVYGSLDAGNIMVGLAVRRLVAAGVELSVARNRALAASCLLMTFAVLTGTVGSRYMALICLMLTALGVAGFLVIYLTLVQDLDPAHVGISSGLLGGLGNLAYGVCSPYIGRLSDLNQTWLTFLIIGLLPWAAFTAVLAGFKTRSGHRGGED